MKEIVYATYVLTNHNLPIDIIQYIMVYRLKNLNNVIEKAMIDSQKLKDFRNRLIELNENRHFPN